PSVQFHIPMLRTILLWNRFGVPIASPFSDGSTICKPRSSVSAVNLTRRPVPASGRLLPSLRANPSQNPRNPDHLGYMNLMNLLNNAAKYTERGGHIWLTVERQGSDVVVSVRDTGIGIDADQFHHIFEMFTQADRSLEKSQGGLGLGLTLVKRIVEMHGGRVEARSDGPGKGSEVVVRLPVVVEASGSSVPTREDETAVPKLSLRILNVDDNRDGADSFGLMLRLMGNDTRTAYDGEEAVVAAGEFRPDV